MKKKNERNYNILIIIGVYLIMVTFFALFNNKEQDMANIIIGGIFFVIVGIIFAVAYFRNLRPANKTTEQLNKAVRKIEDDFKANNSQLLWESYVKNEEKLFAENSLLQKWYDEYIDESMRLNDMSGGFSCDIEDYINMEIFDMIYARHITGLIPGTMTGLGILGTFVGLTIGLKSFHTGSSEEIQNSIIPLMDGIKVAFYTSIYGMIFSLVFNFVYKAEITRAEKSVSRFLSAYRKYVRPDAEHNNISTSMQYQQRITASIGEEFIRTLSENLTKSLQQIMTPQFERMNRTIEDFAKVASRTQTDGMEVIVNHFVDNMNSSLGEKFTDLAEILENTFEMQNANNEKMKTITEDLCHLSERIITINDASADIVKKFSDYTDKLDYLQQSINAGYKQVQKQMETNNTTIIRLKECAETLSLQITKLSEYQTNMDTRMQKMTELFDEFVSSSQSLTKEMKQEFNSYIENVREICKNDINSFCEITQKNLNILSDISKHLTDNMNISASNLNEAVEQLKKSLNISFTDTFTQFDRHLSEICQHLSGTILQIEDSTNSAGQFITTSYSDMEETIETFVSEMKNLISLQMSQQQNDTIHAEENNQDDTTNLLKSTKTVSLQKEVKN